MLRRNCRTRTASTSAKDLPTSGRPLFGRFLAHEKLIAIELSRSEPVTGSDKLKTSDLVQLWDFRQGRLISERTLRETAYPKKDKLDHVSYRRSGYVRFSSDGTFVVAYLDRNLYVLRASDLQELGHIPAPGPPDETQSYQSKSGPQSYVLTSQVTAMELSPTAAKVAFVWVRSFSAWVEVVDFESVKDVVWNAQQPGLNHWPPRAIAWTHNGRQLVLASPAGFPCGRPSDIPDVFAVDPMTGSIQSKLTTGMLVGDIAVTADDRVFAVDCDCVGVFVNHDPKFRVFDLRTGKKLKELAGRGGGVRYVVAASSNGERVVAYTGIVKARFDWGDMLPFDTMVDQTFSVWNLSNYEGIVTSQSLSNFSGRTRLGNGVPMRISPKGGFVVQGDKIYELP